MRVSGHLLPIVFLCAAVLLIVLRLRRRLGDASAPGGRPSFRGTGPRTGLAAALEGRGGRIGLVAAREVRQRVRGRVFRIATVLLLLGVAAAIVIPAATKGKTHPQRVGVVGTLSPSLRRAVTSAAAGVHAQVRVVAEPGASQARDAVRAGRIDLAVVDGDLVIVKHGLDGNTTQTAQLARSLAQVLGVDRALRAARLSAAQQADLAAARPLAVQALEPQRSSGAARATSLFGMIALFVLLTQYLSWTLIGVMEEKSSRVVEVLLATLRPLHLLAGKVIGIGAVVFAQAALVAAFALLLARAVGSDLLKGAAPMVLLSAGLWLVLGYAFYCWLYAAAGSLAERQDQVQSVAVPLALPIVAGYLIGITAVSRGAGPAPVYVDVLAYLPPTAPFEMTTLVGLGDVTWWQFTLSALITAVSVVAMARIAAVVYRRAILRTGRRVRLREVLGDGGSAKAG